MVFTIHTLNRNLFPGNTVFGYHKNVEKYLFNILHFCEVEGFLF